MKPLALSCPSGILATHHKLDKYISNMGSGLSYYSSTGYQCGTNTNKATRTFMTEWYPSYSL